MIFSITAGFLYSIPKVKGSQRELTVYDIAGRDIFVDSANPTENYGGSNILKAGHGISDEARETYFSFHIFTREAYLHFSFSNRPNDLIKAELSLALWSVSQIMNFTICMIEEDWDEETMTWDDNKPNKGQIIDYLVVTSNGISKVDITSIAAGRNEFSICIYIEDDNYIDDYAYITSREGYDHSEGAPKLVWTFLNEDNFLVYNYVLILLVIGIVSIIIIKKVSNKR